MRRAAILATVGLVLASCGSDSAPTVTGPTEIEPADTAAGCGPVIRYPVYGREHVAEIGTVAYETGPPTSGNHFGQWGATGTYEKEIPDEVQVHNLEHGHVVIQYVPGAVEPAILDGLVALARSNDEWVLLAPRSADRFEPEAALAFTAWTVGRWCEDPTPDVLDAAAEFVETYQRTAPEEIAGDPVSETPPAA